MQRYENDGLVYYIELTKGFNNVIAIQEDKFRCYKYPRNEEMSIENTIPLYIDSTLLKTINKLVKKEWRRFKKLQKQENKQLVKFAKGVGNDNQREN